MINEALYSSASVEWSTPQEVFDKLNSEFHFTLDVAATPENAKCERYYTKAEDGLKMPWGGVCLVQPSIRTGNRPVGQESIRKRT